MKAITTTMKMVKNNQHPTTRAFDDHHVQLFSIQRADARPIEDPGERPKIKLARQRTPTRETPDERSIPTPRSSGAELKIKKLK